MDGTQIVNTLSKAIDMLAKKMSVPTSKLYEVIQGQLKFDVYKMTMHVIILSIVIITVIALWKKFVKSLRNEGKWFYNDCENDDGFVTFWAGAGLVVTFVISVIWILIDINSIVQINISPGYYIFKEYIQPLIQQ